MCIYIYTHTYMCMCLTEQHMSIHLVQMCIMSCDLCVCYIMCILDINMNCYYVNFIVSLKHSNTNKCIMNIVMRRAPCRCRRGRGRGPRPTRLCIHAVCIYIYIYVYTHMVCMLIRMCMCIYIYNT